MNEITLIQFLQEGLPFVESIASACLGTILTSLFLRGDTATTEFEKIKAKKFDEVISDLLANGKMTYKDLHDCRNFGQIVKYADHCLKTDPTIESDKERTYEFDWFIRFYEYAGKISNSDMQLLWGKLLAGELNKPGTVSYSLLHALYMMRQEDAQIFSNICRFVLNDINGQPHLFLYLTSNPRAYKKRNITPVSLNNLQRLGLVVCDFHKEYVFQHEDTNARDMGIGIRKHFRSGNNYIKVSGTNESNNMISVGNAVLTPDGEMLCSIIDEDYKRYSGTNLDFIVSMLEEKGCLVQINDTYTTKFT